MNKFLRTWVITIGASDSKEDHEVRIKAQTIEDAVAQITATLTHGQSILASRPARKSKFDKVA